MSTGTLSTGLRGKDRRRTTLVTKIGQVDSFD